jgi:hypothetical protein
VHSSHSPAMVPDSLLARLVPFHTPLADRDHSAWQIGKHRAALLLPALLLAVFPHVGADLQCEGRAEVNTPACSCGSVYFDFSALETPTT